jgi:hypothetical protein
MVSRFWAIARYAAAVSTALVAGASVAAGAASAQGASVAERRIAGELSAVPQPAALLPSFRSVQDSLEWAQARDAAHTDRGERLIINLAERRLIWAHGADTILVARAAVGSGDTLSYGRRSWEFSTPRGRRVVLAKEENPVWVPPLWHYVRHARSTGRELAHLRRDSGTPLSDGTRLVVRGDQVGRLHPGGEFEPIHSGDHIVFDDTVFVPPFGTVNRRITGELGRFKLDLGDAYLIHGTPHKDSIGEAITHGCVRLDDADLAVLHRDIRVGTPVYIY